MYCKQCGNRIADGDVFCSSCGAGIELPAAETRTDRAQSEQMRKQKNLLKKPWLYIGAAVVIAVAVLVVTGVFASVASVLLGPPNVTLVFEDANLEEALRKKLDIWDRDIMSKDVEEVTELNLAGAQVSNIEPLCYFTELAYLDLSSNGISDLSALAGLKCLTQLELGKNIISDLSALGDLEDLTQLDLGSNNISDITVLSRLVKLTDLSLQDNQISSLSSLSGLTSLQSVCLSNNQISDISPLSGLAQLETLVLDGNSIGDISALLGCSCLCELELQDNPFDDISTAAKLEALKQINIKGTNVKDISAIVGKMQIDMDSPQKTELMLGFGDYFMLDQLQLPMDIGDANIVWTSSNESLVIIEGNTALVTNVHDYVYTHFSEMATLIGEVENTNLKFKYDIRVECEPYNLEYEEKPTKYKSKSYIVTGYPVIIEPSIENVTAIDFDYEVTIHKGKLNTFMLRAYVNDNEWKNFDKISTEEEKQGIVSIDFGEPVDLSKYWFVCADKKTGKWNFYAVINKIYYSKQEVDIAALQANSVIPEAVVSPETV